MENCLEVPQKNENCHIIQKIHSCVFIQRKLNHCLKEIVVSPCAQQLGCGNGLPVPPWINE